MAKQPKHGFHENVKNPDLFREEIREIEKAEAAPPPTEKEIARLVASMKTRQLKHEEIQRLSKAKDKAIPYLLEALGDEKVLFNRYSDKALDDPPLQITLDLLEPFGLPPVAVLEPVLQHKDEYFRKFALYHLARCGNDDAIEALKDGLKSEAEQCRTWTLMGLEFLKDSQRGSEKFRAILFEAALPALADKDYGPSEQVPRTLLALDLTRGTQVLLKKDIFSPEYKSVSRVLQALKDRKVKVPADQLRNLLASIKSKATDVPLDFAYADGLILLVIAEGSHAKDLIEDAQRWGNEHVKEGASEAMAMVVGVSDAYGYVSGLYDQKGFKALTEPQLNYLTLWLLDAEVRNGGFSQYYFNSSGDFASHAVRAAKAVGASKLAGIIQKANVLFGAKGPNADRDKRMEQLSKIDLHVLEKLDTQYYECSERLSEMLPKYVASHANDFKPAK